MGEERRLIVDIGMSTGEDSEFYVAKGFDVVAIEANPELVASVGRRFEADGIDSFVTIEHAAIADARGQVSFFLSDDPGWGSLSRERAGAALHLQTRCVEVPGRPLEELLEPYPDPYYIKIDIEGADAVAVRAIPRLRRPPEFVSFECDLGDLEEIRELVALLETAGYQRFQLINQALVTGMRCPVPSQEGNDVDVMFSRTMSGPFGRDLPDRWMSPAQTCERVGKLAHQQSRRSRYAESGRVAGLPLGRFHSQLRWMYNVAPVRVARRHYAAARNQEVGGWFDLHAAR